jgi:hypothetical protein
MSHDNLKGWREDVIAAIKDLIPHSSGGAAAFAIPASTGGRIGIGDRDQRMPFPNKNWGRLDSQ